MSNIEIRRARLAVLKNNCDFRIYTSIDESLPEELLKRLSDTAGAIDPDDTFQTRSLIIELALEEFLGAEDGETLLKLAQKQSAPHKGARRKKPTH